MPRRFFIYGDGAAAGPPAFSAQTVCIDLNGTDENLFNNTPQVYGFADAWTIGLWWKPRDYAANNRILGFDRTAGGEHSITLSMMGAIGQDPMRAELYDNGGSVFKRWDWWNTSTSGAWNFHVFTWDGTDIEMYWNSFLITPDDKGVDGSSTMSDNSDRKLYIGRSDEADYADARIHSVGMWNARLVAAEIVKLWNTGIGNALDWSENVGDYVSSANLKHWWRLGNSAGDIGGDSGSVPIDVDTDASNITAGDDIKSDAPDSEIFHPDQYCIDLDGSTERLGNEDEVAFGIANTWTTILWFKPRSGMFAADSRIFSLRRGPFESNNFILLDIQGQDANDPFRVGLWDSAGTFFKLYTWNNLLVQDAWNMVTVTWDGTNLKLYHDATETVPTTSGTNDAGTMADDVSRIIAIGATVSASSTRWCDGRFHSAGLWGVALTSGEQAELYNSGDGDAVDWGSDGVTYASSADLQHWWRLGQNQLDIGADSGAASEVDLMTDAANIVAANDIVRDSP